MNKLNLKKLLPGFISIVIIAGMTVQSFATNVDMAAFVKKDAYMTKYYELDWKIDEIEKKLERMYKFTCTNVVSFGGTYANLYDTGTTSLQFANYSSGYVGNNQPVAFFDDPNYLRVQRRYLLQNYGTSTSTGTYRAHNNVFKKVYPASVCKWRDGIELLPETKVEFTLSYAVVGINSSNDTITMIMGPFKKFPKIDTYGPSLTTGYLLETPEDLFGMNNFNWANFGYAYGTLTRPTSWTQVSNVYLYGSGTYAGKPGESKFPAVTKDDIENDDFFTKNRQTHSRWYISTSTTAGAFPDLSSRENVWIRHTYQTSGTDGNYTKYISMQDFDMTSWNNNK